MPRHDDRWAVLDAAADSTLVVDRNGTVLYANARTADVFGWPAAELVGLTVDVLVPEELRERHANHMARFNVAPKSRMMGVGLVLQAVHRSGYRLPVEIALSPFDVQGEPTVVASIRDITDRVRLTDELNETSKQLAVVDERDRIARDLHDRVIQRLFASGLHLQASLGRPDQGERIAGVIDEIDEAIREIRTTIFTMHSPRGVGAKCEPSVRVAANEASRMLGHQPSVRVTGSYALIPDDLVTEIVDIVRELLTNVAKHARASATTIDLDVTDGLLVLTVRDNGVGIDPSVLELAGGLGGQGLRNLAERAALRGGSSTLEAAAGGGTVATWTVPLA